MRLSTNLLIGSRRQLLGFTIVELLIVIVVIGILAAVSIVAYNGIQGRAKVASMQSDLTSAAKQLAIDYTQGSSQYPATTTLANGGIGLKVSNGGSYQYTVNNSANPATYCLTETVGSVSYYVSNTSNVPTLGACTNHTVGTSTCPSGFVVVPGNSTFSTSDFCVMKYEAKDDGTGLAVSTMTGSPWGNIAHASAVSTASSACPGCHLITNNEWLTIAANVITVSSNWSGGSVGSGFIYSGHSDSGPSSSLVASTDNDGYSGTGQTTGSNQRRTLTLTNGEVIWDFAGNMVEWVNATIAGGAQPGISGEVSYVSHQYNAVGLLWNGLPVVNQPVTVYSGASGWSSTQGIGRLLSNYGETQLRYFSRGGGWSYGSVSGVLSLNLTNDGVGTSPDTGFRVTK